MSDLIKYPDWQPEYLAAMMEVDTTLLPAKVHLAEGAIFNRHLELASGNGTDSAEEHEAMAEAIRGLQALISKKFNSADGK